MKKMISEHVQQRVAEYGAAASGGSAIVSFTATSLPVVQFVAACVAILSGLLAGAWVAYKFYLALRGKKTPD